MTLGKGINPNSLNNLKSFKEGNPGGPGRPKGSKSFSTILARYLEANVNINKHPETGEAAKVSTQEAIVFTLIAKAIKGDMAAIKEILERIDGKVAQPNIHTGDPEEPISHAISITPIDAAIRELAEKIVKQ